MEKMAKWLLFINISGVAVGLILGACVVMMLHEITTAGNLALGGASFVLFISLMNLTGYFLDKYCPIK